MHTGETAIEYHLRRLDGDALAAFVADLWAARGYETAREGDVVVATHDRGAERIRIRRATGPAGPSTDDPVDVVVALDGGTDGDARVVDAPTLREMLTYAVDRERARELCDRHLGAPPEGLPPDPVTRAKRRATRVREGVAPALVFGTVTAVFVLGAVAWFGAFPLAAGTDTDPAQQEPTLSTPDPVTADSGRETNTEQPATPDGDPFPSSTTTPPPGVNDSSLADVEALARAHDRAMSNRSHTVWLDRDGPDNRSGTGSPIERDLEIAVEGDRYLITTTAPGPDGRERLGAVYHDGTVPYGAVWNESAQRYDRVFTINPRRDRSPIPESVRETVVERYLSTPRTAVTGRASLDGSTVYRVVGRGPPDAPAFDSVAYYRAVALVDARGFVHDVTVEYLETSDSGDHWIRKEVTYGRVGSTTVDPPEWYERRVGNATTD